MSHERIAYRSAFTFQVRFHSREPRCSESEGKKKTPHKIVRIYGLGVSSYALFIALRVIEIR